MNRERAKELLPIIQAYADGETIQFRPAGCVDWLDSDERFKPLWHDDHEYRIKPERRKVWVVFYENGTIPSTYLSQATADEQVVWVRQHGIDAKVVCVEEPE